MEDFEINTVATIWFKEMVFTYVFYNYINELWFWIINLFLINVKNM